MIEPLVRILNRANQQALGSGYNALIEFNLLPPVFIFLQQPLDRRLGRLWGALKESAVISDSVLNDFSGVSVCFQIEPSALRQWIPVPHVLSSAPPLPSGVEPGTGVAVPGTVGVSSQAAVGTGCAIDVAAMQRQLGHPLVGAHIQLLLLG